MSIANDLPTQALILGRLGQGQVSMRGRPLDLNKRASAIIQIASGEVDEYKGASWRPDLLLHVSEEPRR
jgi:hypothetical protein